MRIPDTFIAVPAKRAWPVKYKEPMVIIATKQSYGKGGTRVMFSAPIIQQLGWGESRERQYVQVFISASTIKIQRCDADAPNAIRVTTGKYLTVNTLKDILQLEFDQEYRCKAEVVHGKEIWATYPKELREHVERLNGAVR